MFPIFPARLPCRSARVAGGDDAELPTPIIGWSRKSSAKSTISYFTPMAAATQALADAGWKPSTYEEQIKPAFLIGAGIGGLGGIAETAIV